jgi:muramoyltetrapeptide carboxypeptidase LdcA involved in peptidoglycan recycling
MCVGYADTSAIRQIQQRLSLKTKSGPEVMAMTMKNKANKNRRQLEEWKREKYPFLESNNPRLSMTDADIIEKDI